MMVAGILLLVYREKVKEFTGNIDFAEEKLGVGGTWTFYALLGLGLFMFGLTWLTGTAQSFFESFFGKFF